MTQPWRTDEERDWAGAFGNSYHAYTQPDVDLAVSLLTEALASVDQIASAMEFGAGSGVYLKGLRKLYPNVSLAAVEINAGAVRELRRFADEVYEVSVLEAKGWGIYDLVMATGFLGTVAPPRKRVAYDQLHAACGRYLLIADYYSLIPVRHVYSVPYGPTGIWHADFAGEMAEAYPDLRVLGTGDATELLRSPTPFRWTLFEL